MWGTKITVKWPSCYFLADRWGGSDWGSTKTIGIYVRAKLIEFNTWMGSIQYICTREYRGHSIWYTYKSKWERMNQLDDSKFDVRRDKQKLAVILRWNYSYYQVLIWTGQSNC